MLIQRPEGEKPLKEWLVKRIENVSDSDPDILADFLLALLREQDKNEGDLKAHCIKELETLLDDGVTQTLVDDVFEYLHRSGYLQSAISPEFQSQSFNAPSVLAEEIMNQQNLGVPSHPQPRGPNGRLHGPRKRSYNDRDDESGRNGRESFGNGHNDRVFKQARRGSVRASKGDVPGAKGGRQGSQPNYPAGPYNSFQGSASSGSMRFPDMQSMPPGLPFDPSLTVAMLQTLGGMPGVPGFPLVGSPTGFTPSPSGVQVAPRLDEQGHKNNQVCQDYQRKGYCELGRKCAFQHPAAQVADTAMADEEYDPKSAILPGLRTSSTNEANGRSAASNHHGGIKGRAGLNRSGREGRKDYRSDLSAGGPNHDRSITTVVVENIPEEKFKEDIIREFFSEFGSIAHLDMQPYKRLALIKFADFDSAKRAYSTQRAILDARFIKVYWLKAGTQLPKPPDDGNGGSPAPPRRKNSVPEEEMIDIEEVKQKQAELQRQHEEKMRKKAAAEAEQVALDKRKADLEQRRQEETAKLMAKLAAKKRNSTSKSPENTDTPDVTATGEYEEGGNPEMAALKKQLDMLKKEATSLGIPLSDYSAAYGRERGRGRGGQRGRGFPTRGRGGFDSSNGLWRGRGSPLGIRGGAMRLDNRPRRMIVSGQEFDSAKDEGLRTFLLAVGEYDNIEPNSLRKDSVIISFKDRFTAERFMAGPKSIPNVGDVEFEWLKSVGQSVHHTTSINVKSDNNNGDLTKGEGNRTIEEVQGTKHEEFDVAEDDERFMVD